MTDWGSRFQCWTTRWLKNIWRSLESLRDTNTGCVLWYYKVVAREKTVCNISSPSLPIIWILQSCPLAVSFPSVLLIPVSVAALHNRIFVAEVPVSLLFFEPFPVFLYPCVDMETMTEYRTQDAAGYRSYRWEGSLRLRLFLLIISPWQIIFHLEWQILTLICLSNDDVNVVSSLI